MSLFANHWTKSAFGARDLELASAARHLQLGDGGRRESAWMAHWSLALRRLWPPSARVAPPRAARIGHVGANKLGDNSYLAGSHARQTSCNQRRRFRLNAAPLSPVALSPSRHLALSPSRPLARSPFPSIARSLARSLELCQLPSIGPAGSPFDPRPAASTLALNRPAALTPRPGRRKPGHCCLGTAG